MREREAGEEPIRWEDAIDVDDSDLLHLLVPSSSSSPHPHTLSSLPPPLRPCSRFPPPPQTLAPVPSPSPPSVHRSAEEPSPLPATTTPLIPGPAGAVQAALRRQSASARRDRPLLDDHRMDDHGMDLDEEDGDFKLNPWLCALEFLGEDCDLVWPIDSIKTRATARVPQVVGIVKSCSPNGLGNLFLTLKDPTGSIGASIHHGVFSDCNLDGDISVGCVLILKQVVAFCPARSICYLNATSKNVVKLINKDCGPPRKQLLASFTARDGYKNVESGFGTMRVKPTQSNVAETSLDESGKNYDHNTMMGNQKIGFVGEMSSETCAKVSTTTVAGRPDPGHLKRLWSVAGEQAAMLRVNARKEVTKSLNPQRTIDGDDECLARRLPFSNTITAATTLMSSEPSCYLAGDIEIVVGEAAESIVGHRAYADNEVRRTLNCERVIDSSKMDAGRSFQCDTIAKTSTTTMPSKSDLRINEAKRSIPKVSVAQWTDEQLLELFSDYPDEVELVKTSL
ncbi:unnamed protein product [Musa acuminata subsp. malaccensis]|uniref:(wild Malaysian banana) hypothetical protein n=1 Tax=Musa acuminata subsp. malaccensis TaxID=214687 RepID=A0A804K464_MUSAM|nr:unnamed protein product [Musa acuminata subsp. malaccensis]